MACYTRAIREVYKGGMRMEEKPTYYSIIPADVRYNENLAPNAKLLYAEITSLTNKNGTCWAGDSYFMKLYGVKKRSIQNWLKQLEEYNYIKREVEYKQGSKEIEKRYITLANINALPYGINVHDPMENICVDSITSINTTSNNTKDSVEQAPPYDQIVDYLNSKLNSQYKPTTKETQRFINARYNEGYNLDDFKTVIDIKVDEWIDRPDMSKFLRPKTLFGTNFESYLNQPRPKQEEKFVSVYADRGMV